MPQATPDTLTVRRPDGSTLEATIVKRGPMGRRSEVAGLFEPVVGPTGDVQNVPVSVSLDNVGLSFVQRVHNKLVLTAHADELGYIFYRDMCLHGTGSEDRKPSPVHWEIFKELTRLKAANQVPKTPISAAEMYHPEVARRRLRDHSGVEHIDDDKMAEILQGVRDRHEAETPEIREAARKAGLHVPEPNSGAGLAGLLDQVRRDANDD